MMLTPIKMLRIMVVRTQSGAECHDDHIVDSSTYVIKNAIHVWAIMLSYIRLGICRDRRNRRSCKIFVSCVNFPENNAVAYIFCKFTHTSM